MTIKSNARAFAVYRAIQQFGGRLSMQQISDHTGVPAQRVREIITERGWRGAPDPVEPVDLGIPPELRF